MARQPEVSVHALEPAEAQRLVKITRTARDRVRLRRAAIVLASVQGRSAADAAAMFAATTQYAREVIHAFNELGFAALDPIWSGGRPRRFGPAVREIVCRVATTRPQQLGRPFTTWTRARGGWPTPAQQANNRVVALDALSITPAQVARVIALVASGRLTNTLTRSAIDGVLDGEGGVDEVVVKRRLTVVSDEGELVAAVDAVLAAQPGIAEKIRSGKVRASGAVVGAVMKATGGRADAKRIRELIIERCS